MTIAREENGTSSSYPWSSTARFVASVVIAFYLFVVVLGPLSNPVKSENLTGPLSELAAPFHQSLFLGHGYRFFGPDPGPSHLVYFKVTQANGETIEGHFPDRDGNWPRLLYHRWFMLSETLYNEHAFTPDQEAFNSEQEAIGKAIESLRTSGSFEEIKVLEAQRLAREQRYRVTRKRISEMVTAIENSLLKRYEGSSVQLYLRERALSEPLDITNHVKLDDPRFLSPLMPIGSAAAENKEPVLELLPVAEESADGSGESGGASNDF